MHNICNHKRWLIFRAFQFWQFWHKVIKKARSRALKVKPHRNSSKCLSQFFHWDNKPTEKYNLKKYSKKILFYFMFKVEKYIFICGLFLPRLSLVSCLILIFFADSSELFTPSFILYLSSECHFMQCKIFFILRCQPQNWGMLLCPAQSVLWLYF